MKRALLLLILLIGTATSYSQDTINNYLTSGCLYNQMKSVISPNGPPFDISFNYINDSLRITGKIGANCGSAHIAVINKTKDTIFITTMDTGRMTTCDCAYNFGLWIKSLSTDTLIKFNGKKYNSKGLYSEIKILDSKDDLIYIYPNPTGDYLKIKPQPGIKIIRISISDVSGRFVKTILNEENAFDLTGLKSELYFVDFEINGQRHVIKKILKK